MKNRRIALLLAAVLVLGCGCTARTAARPYGMPR